MKRRGIVKTSVRYVLAAATVLVGATHFTDPAKFVRIVPPWLPAPGALVAISGFFEILGGVGLLVPRVRRAAAWGLIALYVAVFPANVHMALHHVSFGDAPAPDWALWLRLPLQGVLIALAYWLTRPEADSTKASPRDAASPPASP